MSATTDAALVRMHLDVYRHNQLGEPVTDNGRRMALDALARIYERARLVDDVDQAIRRQPQP